MSVAELLEHIRAEAMKLPEKERFRLALDLEDSVLSDVHDLADELSPDTQAEILRRADIVRRGESEGRPAHEVLADIRTRLAER